MTLMKVLFVLLAIASVVGCGDATQSAVGGEDLFDAAAPATFATTQEDAGTGSLWTDLYRDYFGPTGAASCTGNNVCHGDSTQPGAMASDFICGDDPDTCYMGLTSVMAGLVQATTPGNEATTSLELVLRQTTGNGTMPKEPMYTFSVGDIARISAWLAAGHPNN
jgi:hypothetical protein